MIRSENRRKSTAESIIGQIRLKGAFEPSQSLSPKLDVMQPLSRHG
jgi:hypothetical protein